jgi:hypothetical protein
MGVWISKVAHHPTTVWWAAHQLGLHSDVQQRIRWELERTGREVLPVVRKAWRHLFEAWSEKRDEFNRDWFDLKAVIAKEGWDNAVGRTYAAIGRPYLTAKRTYGSGPKPPEEHDEIPIGDLLRVDVEYPHLADSPTIPDSWLAMVTRELRKNLELALHLESEVGRFGLSNISPIVPDDAPDDDRYGRTHGLSGNVMQFAALFERLVNIDVAAAQHELSAWPVNDNTIFSRLRIWAYGKAELIPAQALGPALASLSDEAFWDRYHQRDLLLVLAGRWKDLLPDAQKELEARLLKGPTKWEDEDDAHYEERRAWASVDRITWLASKGCNFTFDMETEVATLRSAAPEWKLEYADKAAESLESRGGWVRTEKDYSELLNVPLSSLLNKASELTGRAGYLEERDPFAGLSDERPVRALAALTKAAKGDEFPEWAWRTFLISQSRKDDKPKLLALIAERIARYPDHAVAAFIRPAADWLANVSKGLARGYPAVFDKVLAKLISVLRAERPDGNSAGIVRRSKEPDWTMEAINAPVGKIAEALFSDPRTDSLKAGAGLPEKWVQFARDLLSLPGDLRRHALVIFAHNLNWFHLVDPNWTAANMLSLLDHDDGYDQKAFWSGFFWGSRVPNQRLYERIKRNLLSFTKEGSLPRRGYGEVLAGIILAGWGSRNEETNERWISNDEMRDVLLHVDDEFRSQILWQAKTWSETQGDTTGEKWSEKLPELLRDVWPRQKAVKTPTVSTRLCDIAFASPDRFPEMVKIVLPLVSTVDSDHLSIPNLHRAEDSLVDLYPRETLALLHAVLPEKVIGWPYDIESILDRIGAADSSLRTDERLLELKRRWNSR